MADRVLVVESEEAVRRVILSMLSSAKYECQGTANGLDALAMLASGIEFELVLCSLMTPSLQSDGFGERVKDKYPDIPVVVITSVQDIPIALNAIRKGVDDHLLKPFDREQLINTVSRALKNRRLRVENKTYRTNLESLVKARTDQLQAAMGSLERSYDATVEVLGEALCRKDASTEGHTKRVTLFAIGIAQALGLPRDRVAIIARGAFLHDIGKIAIPDAILVKPGKLEPDEVTIMKQHAYHGYQIAKKVPFLAEAAEIVYAHHEWFDGNGYPRHLKGDEIPLGARIVAVANTLDSITSDLPYRPAQTISVARKEIRIWSGRQFDPEITKVFLEMPDKIWEDLKREVSTQTHK